MSCASLFGMFDNVPVVNATGCNQLLMGKVCMMFAALQGKGCGGVKAYVESKGLVQLSDPAQIEAMIDSVLAANQKQLEQYRAGKTKLQGHFVG